MCAIGVSMKPVVMIKITRNTSTFLVNETSEREQVGVCHSTFKESKNAQLTILLETEQLGISKT